MISLLYVSRSLLPPAQAEAAIASIIGASLANNPALAITGALAFTERHFAQILEGPEAAVEEMMRRMERDPRHSHIRIVERIDVAERRFGGWSMAYAGPSRWVDQHIEPLAQMLLSERARADWAEQIVALLREFVHEPADAGRPAPSTCSSAAQQTW